MEQVGRAVFAAQGVFPCAHIEHGNFDGGGYSGCPRRRQGDDKGLCARFFCPQRAGACSVQAANRLGSQFHCGFTALKIILRIFQRQQEGCFGGTAGVAKVGTFQAVTFQIGGTVLLDQRD